MILSLVRAEALKLRRQRAALFFGFFLVPAFATFISCALGGSLSPRGDGHAILPLFHSITRALGIGGNPIAQLFFALGAATIFSVDYRYSGWRHIVPRSGRASLIGAKIIVFALFAGASLLLVAAGDILANLIVALIRGMTPVVIDRDALSIRQAILSFGISLLELVALGGIVAAVATATRSMMAAVILPFLLSLAASSAEAYLGNAIVRFPLPTFAADALRLWLGGGAVPAPATIAALSLTGWCIVGFGLAITLFQRQDLVAE
jgi:hypothetical protein